MVSKDANTLPIHQQDPKPLPPSKGGTQGGGIAAPLYECPRALFSEKPIEIRRFVGWVRSPAATATHRFESKREAAGVTVDGLRA